MSATDTSPLLQLPGELRNRIYQLVLTEPYKVFPWKGKSTNHLRLVCRQLHAEANWLELLCNNPVTFICEDLEQPGPAQQFIAFAEVVPKPCLQAQVPQEIFDLLNDNAQQLPFISETLNTLVELSEVYRSLPQMEVRYTLPGFSLDTENSTAVVYFMLKGIYYSYALRGSFEQELWPETVLMHTVVSVFAELGREWRRVPMDQERADGMRVRLEAQQREGLPLSSSITVNILQQYRQLNSTICFEACDSLWVPNLKLCACPFHMEKGRFLQLFQQAANESHAASIILRDLLAEGLETAWEDAARRWLEDGN
ncbi:hypothetical protein EK21DRAFT_118288 [Setomelanomma holmii]|uniref:Uncharacterized protein n=1 Tax=Setomelanomma holmii TaxID=210430 RepID=A0A9P4GYM7_9PLEO|nr:hypothetical protein EK21DRAFT_118288 [Setomelanomma holmii]